jgi:branched-chain amino acid transport system ATP-binding protein
MAEPVLRADRLSKRFGALAAVADVSIDLVDGECHAVIGPNGAGKTTLLGLLSGELAADSGTVSFAGRDVTWLRPSRRALAGFGRTFQATELCREFSARRNVMLAVQSRVGTPFHFLRRADSLATLAARADAALVTAGLAERAQVPAGLLSHGEQRQLELAVAMAARPRALLLDEPAAGLGPAETAEMAARLAALKGKVAMLLVEHDMDTVFRLADRITVMAEGRVIAAGAPEAIRANLDVREAYLGEVIDA